MTETLLLVDEYLDELKKQKSYQEFIKISKIIDEKYLDELEKLNQTKQKFDDILDNGGKYHPDYKIVSEQFIEQKTKVFNIPEVKLYFKLLDEVETTINNLLNDIARSISPNIPVFNKFGFIENKGGSCVGCR